MLYGYSQSVYSIIYDLLIDVLIVIFLVHLKTRFSIIHCLVPVQVNAAICCRT